MLVVVYLKKRYISATRDLEGYSLRIDSVRYTVTMFRLIVWVVIGVLALSFFGISLENLLSAPTTQNNFDFLFRLLSDGWAELVSWAENIGAPVRDIIKK
jgi:hypothetical protein